MSKHRYTAMVLGCMFLAVLLVALVGCGGSTTTTSTATTASTTAGATTTAGAATATTAGASTGDSIVIGFDVGLTGKYAAPESPLVNGVKMAVEEVNAAGGINGKKIDLAIEDTGSEQTGAINAYNRVVAKHPIAIMNTTLSSFVLAQMDLIKESAIPTLTGASNPTLTDMGNPWLFRIRTSDAVVAQAATQYAIDGFGAGKKIGLIYANDEYGTGGKNVVEATMKAAGQTLVAEEATGVNDTDVSAQLLKLKAAGAEVVISWDQPTVQAIIMKQSKQLGMTYQLMMAPSGVLPTTLKLVTPDDSNGVYGVQSSIPTQDPRSKDWATRYQAEFKLTADSSAAEYYDGLMMVADALKGGATTPKAVADYLMTIKGKQGMGNTWTFAPKGDGGRQALVVKVNNNALSPVKTIVVQ